MAFSARLVMYVILDEDMNFSRSKFADHNGFVAPFENYAPAINIFIYSNFWFFFVIDSVYSLPSICVLPPFGVFIQNC